MDKIFKVYLGRQLIIGKKVKRKDNHKEGGSEGSK